MAAMIPEPLSLDKGQVPTPIQFEGSAGAEVQKDQNTVKMEVEEEEPEEKVLSEKAEEEEKMEVEQDESAKEDATENKN